MNNSDRHPRNHFTETLKSICERLHNAEPFESVEPCRYRKKQRESRAIAQELWVVGSYARGALTCGDLDIVLSISMDSRFTGEGWTTHRAVTSGSAKISDHFVGRKRGVSVYFGTPGVECNSSGVPFEEAVLVWRKSDGPGQWLKRINAIRPDPEATRFYRPYDDFPLKPEQIGNLLDVYKSLAKEKEDGLIDWCFIPFQPAPDNFEIDMGRFRPRLGKKATEALEHLCHTIKNNQVLEGRWRDADRNSFIFGGNHITIQERPIIHTHDLDSPLVSSLCFVPFITKTGPNGIWQIKRGKNHPLTKKVEHLTLYTNRSADLPSTLDALTIDSMDLDERFGIWRRGTLCELFTSREGAEDNLYNWEDDGWEVVELTGNDALNLVAMCDRVEIDREFYDPSSIDLAAIMIDSAKCNATDRPKG